MHPSLHVHGTLYGWWILRSGLGVALVVAVTVLVIMIRRSRGS
jgi:hypothetical protein